MWRNCKETWKWNPCVEILFKTKYCWPPPLHNIILLELDFNVKFHLLCLLQFQSDLEITIITTSYFQAISFDWKSVLSYLSISTLSNMQWSTKRYSIIDQHLARHFKNNVAGLLSPPPFLCSQINTPFSHLIRKGGCAFSITVESVYPYSSSILQFLLIHSSFSNWVGWV